MEFDEILRGHGQRVPIRDALFDVRAEQLNEMGRIRDTSSGRLI
ncbi:MAG: hypothetical protein ACLR78_13430 [Roseburia sp.]